MAAGLVEQRLAVSDRDGAARVAVRVKPRASKTAILGVRESALDLSLSSQIGRASCRDRVCLAV